MDTLLEVTVWRMAGAVGGSVDEENRSSQVYVMLGNMVEVLGIKHRLLLNQAY